MSAEAAIERDPAEIPVSGDEWEHPRKLSWPRLVVTEVGYIMDGDGLQVDSVVVIKLDGSGSKQTLTGAQFTQFMREIGAECVRKASNFKVLRYDGPLASLSSREARDDDGS